MNTNAQDPFDFHVARVLLLVDAFSRGAAQRLEGLTKLAKLDFLLRYPLYLEKLLTLRERPLPPLLRPTSNERLGLESAMIRYKYGPWDDRYYPVIGRLIGMGLASSLPGRATVSLRVTEAGRKVVASLADGGWERTAGRAAVMHRDLNLSGASLQKLIYETFPEVVDRPWREVIL